MENLGRGAVDHILVRNSEYLHRNGVLAESLGDEGSQTAETAVLLDGHYAPGLACGFQDGVLIEGLDPGQIEHPCIDAAIPEPHTGTERVVNRLAGTYYSYIVAFKKCIRLPYLEIEIVIFIYIRNGGATHPDIYRLGEINQELHEFGSRTGVGRKDYVHTGEAAQHRYVVQAVMGSAEGAVCHSSAHSENLCGILAVCEIHFHLLEAARHIEACRTAAEIAEKYLM